VVSPTSELIVDDESVQPRDELARPGLADLYHFGQPDPAFPRAGLFHQPKPDANGFVKATLINHSMDFGAFIHYRRGGAAGADPMENDRCGGVPVWFGAGYQRRGRRGLSCASSS